MAEPLPIHAAANGDAAAAQKQPPFVQILKVPEGCSVATNLVDPFLALALLRMGEQQILKLMEPKLVKPGSMQGLLKRMQR